MKKNTKGFTLIELLAVIVILAIIALIATPIVLNLINKAREGASKDTAFGVKKAAELYYAESLITNTGAFTAVDFTCNKTTCTATGRDPLNIDGTVPDGTVSINAAGEVTFTKLNVNGYCWTYSKASGMNKENCAS